jgi:hypothetical protein
MIIAAAALCRGDGDLSVMVRQAVIRPSPCPNQWPKSRVPRGRVCRRQLHHRYGNAEREEAHHRSQSYCVMGPANLSRSKRAEWPKSESK